MEERKVTCDSCGTNLTDGGQYYDYRVTLYSESLPPSTAAVVDILIEPQLDREYHFCGLGCLNRWLRKRLSEEPK